MKPLNFIEFCFNERERNCEIVKYLLNKKIQLKEINTLTNSSFCSPIHSSVCPYFYQTLLCLYIYPSLCTSVLLSVRLSFSLFIYTPLCASIAFLSASSVLYVHLSFSLYIYLFACTSIHLSVLSTIFLPINPYS